MAVLYFAHKRKRRAAPYSRSEIFRRWGHACAYCDGMAEHLDHIKPLSRGGKDELANVIPACADCNLAKAALTLAEWAQTFGAGHPIHHQQDTD